MSKAFWLAMTALLGQFVGFAVLGPMFVCAEPSKEEKLAPCMVAEQQRDLFMEPVASIKTSVLWFLQADGRLVCVARAEAHQQVDDKSSKELTWKSVHRLAQMKLAHELGTRGGNFVLTRHYNSGGQNWEWKDKKGQRYASADKPDPFPESSVSLVTSVDVAAIENIVPPQFGTVPSLHKVEIKTSPTKPCSPP
jgi:hypothetical protein